MPATVCCCRSCATYEQVENKHNDARVWGVKVFSFLGVNQVLPGVGELVEEVQVEGTFPDGTKLVSD